MRWRDGEGESRLSTETGVEFGERREAGRVWRLGSLWGVAASARARSSHFLRTASGLGADAMRWVPAGPGRGALGETCPIRERVRHGRDSGGWVTSLSK